MNERKGRFRAEHISMWDVPAEPCVAMVQPDSEVLKAFLPGASVLMCILRWSATLRWPLNDDSSGGISTYELAAHFVGVTGFRDVRRVNFILSFWIQCWLRRLTCFLLRSGTL